MLMGSVAVVFGGRSNESEISVITGTMAANVLKSGGVSVIPVYISQEGKYFCDEKLADIEVFKRGEEQTYARCFVADGGLYLLGKRGKIKKFLPVYAALNCCHGGLGEGGGLGGVFAAAGIPLAGGDIFGGSAFIDKYYTKIIMRGLGVRALPYAVVRVKTDVTAAIKKTGLPAIIKPARLGSSIGVVKAQTEEEYCAAAESALCYDEKAVCERYLEVRREINCAAYFAEGKIHVSECEEAKSSGELLSFDDKYSGGGQSVIPADLPDEVSDRIRRITGSVYGRLNMRGIVRFDYLLSCDNIYLSEINTVPGSLGWYLFAKTFKEFCPVLKAVIEQAVIDSRIQGDKKILRTGILNSVPTFGGKLK